MCFQRKGGKLDILLVLLEECARAWLTISFWFHPVTRQQFLYSGFTLLILHNVSTFFFSSFLIPCFLCSCVSISNWLLPYWCCNPCSYNLPPAPGVPSHDMIQGLAHKKTKTKTEKGERARNSHLNSVFYFLQCDTSASCFILNMYSGVCNLASATCSLSSVSSSDLYLVWLCADTSAECSLINTVILLLMLTGWFKLDLEWVCPPAGSYSFQ